MHRLKFDIDGKTFEFETPDKWNELTPDQLCYMAPRVLFAKPSEELIHQMMIVLLKPGKRYLKLMNMSQFEALHPIVTGFWKENNLTEQILPVLKVSIFRKLYGPESELKNITAAEFAFADKFLGSWLKKKDERMLNYMVACLYRPVGDVSNTADKRERFDETKLDRISDQVAKLSFQERVAVAAFFIGCRAVLVKKFQNVFSAPASSTGKKNRSGWLGFFYDMAGPKLGTYHDVAAMNLYELLFILDKLTEDARDAKRRESLKKRGKR